VLLGTRLLIHQPSYSMLNRWIEADLPDVIATHGIGCIAFSLLAQGMLTERISAVFLRAREQPSISAHQKAPALMSTTSPTSLPRCSRTS
jgi:aryl-alcohol dehydrogenase-like predicted oxidoreductase